MNTSALEETVFAGALALPQAKRGAFLDNACSGDAALRARVEALLSAAKDAPTYLDEPPTLPPFPRDEELPGTLMGRYKLLEKLGEGGCGAVWAAEQREPVKRRVALKIIKLGMDTRQVIARFEAERQALAMMDHPNIARMLDAGATDTGRPFFVMELVRGIPITAYCDENNLNTSQRLELAIKVCHAIQHAHQKGIIHRDIKPSNVLITLHDGVPVPKVIDFGIAKATQQELTDKTLYTKFQQFIGTPAYMSPEQAEMSGLDIDTRSDVYSLGVLVYELVTGRTPFDSKELLQHGVDEIRRTIREKEPPRPSTRIETMQDAELTTTARRRSTDARKLAATVRGDLDWVVMKCLEKHRTRRYDTATGLATDLQRYLAHEPVVARPPSTAYRMQKFVRRHRAAVVATTAILGVLFAGSITVAWQASRALRAERAQNELREATRRAELAAAAARRAAELEQQRSEKIRWARETALPEIDRLLKKDDASAAFALAREAQASIANDPAFIAVWSKLSALADIESDPAGADVYVKPYSKPAAEWEHLGQTPLKDVRLRRELLRWRITKPGYADLERAVVLTAAPRSNSGAILFSLIAAATAPEGMVRIPRAADLGAASKLPPFEVGEHWIDKYEVTNRQFKAFVDAGGYTTQKWWKVPLAKDDKVLDWAEAMRLFVDTTGRPGPATWVNGSYPAGRDNHPVIGVSWFEAAAYAEFAGKRLPSIFQWHRAHSSVHQAFFVPLSNFNGESSAPVGQYQGMSWAGVYDLAGNAKEWCWNEAEAGKRYILGGGWNEPEYMFMDGDARSPFERSISNGFRCAKVVAPAVADGAIDAPLPRRRRNFTQEKPVSDAEFSIIQRLYSYDKTSLDPQIDLVDESNPRWRLEKVSFNAAYNNERITAYLYLPKSVPQPYQAVVFFPNSSVFNSRISEETLITTPMINGYVIAGRAVIFPIYQGSFGRGKATRDWTTAAGRDWTIQIAKDLGRAIDYLETRTDIRSDKLAYAGNSLGGKLGSLLPALEPRLKVSVLINGGFYYTRPLPEADELNFAPRVKIPTLMLNGRYDYTFPVETAQLPMFQTLGTPLEHKRHVIYETGHNVPANQTNAEVIAWLDRYLGPVK